jgi:hypothetical protein
MRSQCRHRSGAVSAAIGAVNVGRTLPVQNTGEWRAEYDDDPMLAAGT